ncbi:S8 family peptidase [Streptomyces yaizuensis]|uniref:S8 family peptidase n=1 Tax=Streptomyces yaizuensis TaxID=2989713 RepID=A0ABQ5P9A1_9ACTN|nr:S8 family peptidase [Streptomyces sp. YSPA8]GLF99137.1 S8 family peptidase [Streptomyces sp. YSPA8]
MRSHHFRARTRTIVPAVLAVAVSALTGPAAATPPPPVPVPLTEATEAVPGQYIVLLESGTTPASVLSTLGATPRHVYEHALNGFSAALTPAQLEAVRILPGVRAVEENAVGRAPATVFERADAPASVPGGRGRSARPVSDDLWGLDRIDQRYLPLDGQYNAKSTGKDIRVYVVDSGIDASHPEFGGRVSKGADYVNDGNEFCGSHGTHVAGTIGGRTVGVAPGTRLVSLRVNDCADSGSLDDYVAAFEWAVKDAEGHGVPAVLNASLGGSGRFQAIDDATRSLWKAGVLPVVAAGNERSDACGLTPANSPFAFTVAATDSDDKQYEQFAGSGGTNYGKCVQLYAPGKYIYSAFSGGGYGLMSGTSMATPHVAGAAALYKEVHPKATAADVWRWLLDSATPGQVTDPGPNTPNLLLYLNGI